MQTRRGWVSHHQRAQILHAQEAFFKVALETGDISSSPYCHDVLIGARGGLWVDTTDFPIQWVFLKPEQLMELSHGGQRIFTDPRALTLIEQSTQLEGVRLVGSIGRLGEFAVVTLATFLVEPAEGSLGVADDSESGACLHPLHVDVKTLEVVDEGQMWQTGRICARRPDGTRPT